MTPDDYLHALRDQLAAQTQHEKAIHLPVAPPTSATSAFFKQKLLCSSQTPVQFNDFEFIPTPDAQKLNHNRIVAGMPTYQIKTMATDVSLKAYLCNVHLTHFNSLRTTLSLTGVSNIIIILKKFAHVINGRIIIRSDLLYPYKSLQAWARNVILKILLERVHVKREEVIAKVGLIPRESLENLIGELCYWVPKLGWRLKLNPEQDPAVLEIPEMQEWEGESRLDIEELVKTCAEMQKPVVGGKRKASVSVVPGTAAAAAAVTANTTAASSTANKTPALTTVSAAKAASLTSTAAKVRKQSTKKEAVEVSTAPVIDETKEVKPVLSGPQDQVNTFVTALLQNSGIANLSEVVDLLIAQNGPLGNLSTIFICKLIAPHIFIFHIDPLIPTTPDAILPLIANCTTAIGPSLIVLKTPTTSHRTCLIRCFLSKHQWRKSDMIIELNRDCGSSPSEREFRKLLSEFAAARGGIWSLKIPDERAE